MVEVVRMPAVIGQADIDWAALSRFAEFVGVVAFVALTFAVLGYLLLRLRENSFREVIKSWRAETESNNKERDRQWEVITAQREDGKALQSAVLALPDVLKASFATALADALRAALADTAKGHAEIIEKVNAHVDAAQADLGGKFDATLRGVEARLGTKVDDGLKIVRVSTDALAAGIEVQHQDNRAALETLSAANTENAKTAGELRRLAELVESAKNVQDERAQAVVAEIMKAITPRLDQIAETLRVVLERLTPPATLPEPLPAADEARVTVTEAKA